MNLVNLVLAGGGAKGFAYVGVARALEENGILNNIRKFVGTNTGSIVAAMLCVGFNSYDVEALMPLTMELLHRDSWRIIRTPNSMEWHPSHKFQKYLGDVLALKTEKPSITFAEVCQKYKKELCITAINAGGKEEIFDSTVAANIAIPYAICQSIHIPAVKNDDKTVIYDGGFMFNYPIHCSNEPAETLGCLTYSEDSKNMSEVTKSSSEVQLTENVDCMLLQESFVNVFTTEENQEFSLDGFKQIFETIQKSVKSDGMYKARLYAEMMYGLDVQSDNIYTDIKKTGNVTQDDIIAFQTKNQLAFQQRNTKMNDAILSFDGAAKKAFLTGLKKEHVGRTIDINTGIIGASDFSMKDDHKRFLITEGKSSTEKFLQDNNLLSSQTENAPKTTSLKENQIAEITRNYE